jgi:transposase-like protein
MGTQKIEGNDRGILAMTAEDRFNHWVGIATGTPQCPYCGNKHITEAKPTKARNGRHFTCGGKGKHQNYFSNKRLVGDRV